MIAYKHYKFFSIFYFVLLSPSRTGVHAYDGTCHINSNTVCYGLFVAGLVAATMLIFALLYKLIRRCQGTNRTNNMMDAPRNIYGVNNANLQRIDRGDDSAYNARIIVQNHTPLEIGEQGPPPFQPTQLSELAEFDNLYLRESCQGTDQTKRQWNELSSSSSSTPIDGSTREHTVVRMNELYDESRRSSDVTVPPPPYTSKP